MEVEVEPSLYYGGRDKVISPPPVALVEGRRRGQWCLPGTTDSLGAREAKVLHQVNQVVAQSEIRRHPVDRFYARHFDLRQGGCRRFVRPDRRRLLRMCRKRLCQSNASEQADEFASVHSITSSARASISGGISSLIAFAVLRLMARNVVGWLDRSCPGFRPLRASIQANHARTIGRSPNSRESGRNSTNTSTGR
jgi:hypothetical protein